ncbi:TPA: threonine synthase, partial [Aeromonas hydrophila]
EGGWIQGGERVVVLNTGAGIKYPDAITVVPQRLRRDGRIPA